MKRTCSRGVKFLPETPGFCDHAWWERKGEEEGTHRCCLPENHKGEHKCECGQETKKDSGRNR